MPGGGLAAYGQRWIACRPGFFLPVRVLSRRFRTVLLAELQHAFQQGRLRFGGNLAHLAEPAAFQRYLRPLRRCEWVVYAKPPFDGPARVLAYLGRYTHRVAISNERILDISDGCVRFRWNDYRQQHRWKTLALPAAEFIRRVLLHTLPPGFHRILNFGFLAGPRRKDNLALCRRLLDMPPSEPSAAPPADYRERYEALTGRALRVYPACGRGTMLTVEMILAGRQRPPPWTTPREQR